MRFRNTYEAFDGDIEIGDDKKDGTLTITWKKDIFHTTLEADFRTLTYRITYYDVLSKRDCTL